MPPAQAFQAAFPDAASKAGVLKARAAITCTVLPGGLLGDCEAASEGPPGYGFAAATLPLAPAFRVRAWGSDGRPVIGGKVRVPIRYELQQAPDPAVPKP
jgi:protein TonB